MAPSLQLNNASRWRAGCIYLDTSPFPLEAAESGTLPFASPTDGFSLVVFVCLGDLASHHLSNEYDDGMCVMRVLELLGSLQTDVSTLGSSRTLHHPSAQRF